MAASEAAALEVPSLRLDEVELYRQSVRLYRFDNSKWVEQGFGDAELLQCNDTGKVCFELWDQTSGQKLASHYVVPHCGSYCDLKSGSDTTWVWAALDNSAGADQDVVFGLRFHFAAQATAFKDKFENAKRLNEKVKGFKDSSDFASSVLAKAYAAAATVEQAAHAEIPIHPGDATDKDSGAGGWFSGIFSKKPDEKCSSKRVQVTVVKATNLKHLNYGGDSMWCECEVIHKDRREKPSKFQTKAIKNSLDPEWNETHELDHWYIGETLKITIYDQGWSGATKEGTVVVGSKQFFPRGFDGELAIGEIDSAKLTLRIQTMNIEAEETPSVTGISPTKNTSLSPEKPTEQDDDQYVAEEEVMNIPGWQASMTLEVKDTVEYGTEEEEELYSQRSKLYRFRDGEWKERGVGEAKLLKHKTTGKVRFLMRQEKTQKIVANHLTVKIVDTPYCDLKPNAGSDKCWVWTAQDCADGDQANEKFALKFGQPELAQKFKVAFEEACETNKNAVDLDAPPQNEPKVSTPAAVPNLSPPQSASGGGYPPMSSEQKTSPNPFEGFSFAGGASSPSSSSGGLFSSAAAAAGAKDSNDTFKSGTGGGIFGSTGGGLFGSPGTSNDKTGGGLFGAPASGGGVFSSTGTNTGGALFGSGANNTGGLFGLNSASTGGGLFGNPAPSSGGLFGTSAPSTSGGIFGSPSKSTGGGLFGGAPASTGGGLFGSPPTSTGGGLFGSSSTNTGGGLFGSSTTNTGGGLLSTPAAEGGMFGSSSAPSAADVAPTKDAEDDDNYVPEEEVTVIPGWQPSFTWDGNHTVELGEEDEDIIYSQRSKLFRMRDKEWKERGLGDAKLMKHRTTGKVRFLMRQEKTQKIVANFLLVDTEPYCVLKPNAGSEQIWNWSAHDNSEDEVIVENFALKFKTPELAQEFKVAFENAKSASSTEAGPKEVPIHTPPLSPDGGAEIPPSEDKSRQGSWLSGIFGGKAAEEKPPTKDLEVTIIRASNLKHLNYRTDAPWCVCEVKHKDKREKPSKFQTKVIKDTLDPEWNETHEIQGWHIGEDLVFTVYDQGWTGSSTEGTVTVRSDEFYPHGFNDSLPITGLSDAFLDIRIQALGEDGAHVRVSEDVAATEENQVSQELFEDSNGEEEVVFSHRAKLYIFRENEWQERGLGNARLLKHKESGKVRFMLRHEKTRAIVANQYVVDHAPYCQLVPNVTSEKCWVWTAMDDSDGDTRIEQFALMFGVPAKAQEFKIAFDSAKEMNSKVQDSEFLALSSSAAQPSSPERVPAAASVASSKSVDSGNTVGGIFGGGTGGSIFGTPSSGGSLFGTPSSGSFLFSSSAPSSGSLFGGSPSSGGLFGSSTPSGGLFGGSSGSGSLFGGASGGEAAPQPASATAAEDDNYVEDEPEVVNIPGWAPSVTLEVRDTVETGEEVYEDIYSQRSKLFRFRDKEWKERGLGEAKLQKHRESGQIRFLLRQEKTGKIVANFVVGDHPPYCQLVPNPGSDKCWQWTAQDYSEDEVQTEQFLLKFGSVDLAGEFKKAFENAKSAASLPTSNSNDGVQSAKSKSPSVSPKIAPTTEAPSVSIFGAPAATTGGLFGTPSSTTGTGLFGGGGGGGSGLFGSAPSTGGLFSSTSNPSTSGGLFGGPASASTGGLFSSAASSSATGGLFGGTSAPSSGGWLFGTGGGSASGGGSSGSSSGIFSGMAALAGSGDTQASPSPFGGGLAGLSHLNNGTSGTGSNVVAAAPSAPADADDEYVQEEEVTEVAGWKPSITLQLAEVQTGEEHEETLYSQRSKLFRFRDGEWKERGLGEAKLLRNAATGVTRFLLRQENTGKIVANHAVIDTPPYCELVPQGEKSWIWKALDYADEEKVAESFALKFGSTELRDGFKKAFDQAKQQKPTGHAGSKNLAASPKAAPSANTFGTSASMNGGIFGATGGMFGATVGGGSTTGGIFNTGNTAGSSAMFSNAGQSQSYDNEDDGDAVEDYDAYDYEEDYNDVGVTGTNDAPKSFAALIAEQSQGWRCDNCRMTQKDDVTMCPICEIPRPGYEDVEAQKKKDKEAATAKAAALFTGGGGGGTGFNLGGQATSFAAPAPTGFTFGGGGTAAATPAPFGGGGTAAATPAPFGGGGAATATTAPSIFGGTSSNLDSSEQPKAPTFGQQVPIVTTPQVVPPPIGATTKSAMQAPPATLGGGIFAGAGGAVPPMPGPPPPQAEPANGTWMSPPPPPSSAPDVTNVMAAMMQAMLAAQKSASSGSSSESEFRRLESEIQILQDRLARADDRAQRADERARHMEENLNQSIAKLREREQELSNTVRQASQQHASDKHEIECLKQDLRTQMAQSDEARRKHMEDIAALRREMGAQAEEFRRAQASSEDVVRRVKTQQDDHRRTIDTLMEELRAERAERHSWLARERETINSMQSQLRAEFKQEVGSLQKDMKASLGEVHTAVESIEANTKSRVEELEGQMNKCYVEALKKLSVPDRIMYYQTLHSQSGAQAIGGVGMKENGHTFLELTEGSNGTHRDTQGAPRHFKQMFGRMSQ